MFKYVWIMILAGLYLAWTIRSIVDGIQWFIHRKESDFIWEDYGGLALVWLGLHLVVLFAFSFTAYNGII